jgi:diguanylate cyclase (GGDEF)-like protein
MAHWFTHLALPGTAWLPLGLGALAPLLLAAVIVVSRRHRRGIATVLALRTVVVLGVGFATLAAVATLAVVQTGLSELRERHLPELRTLGEVLERNTLGPVGGDAVLRLALFRAKDPNVGFVAAGSNSCRGSCVVSADASFDLEDLKRHLIANWPATPAGSHADGPMMLVGGRPYLLVASPVRDANGVRATLVAGVNADYLAQQATRTAWVLLGISYALLVVVGWISWQQVSRSLSTRIYAITSQLKSGSVHEENERLEVDGHELRELADSVAEYIKRNVETRRSSDERYRRLIELAPDAVLICSKTGITFANSAAIALAGARNRYDLMGAPVERFLEFEETVPGTPASALRPAKWKRTDGGVLHVEVAEVADSTDGDTVRQYLVRDVTHRRLREAALAHRAEHDSLTGLVNRARFETRLTELLDPASAPIDPAAVRDIAVLFIDLDGFKPVNDQYGHAAGDAVLVAVAVRLRDSTRGTDLIARFGGDEFAVLLQVRDEAEVRTVAQRILNAIRQPILIDGAIITVGASLGVATTRPGRQLNPVAPAVPFISSVAAAELLRMADAAMYDAKSQGGDKFTTSDESSQSPQEEPDVKFLATA